MSASTSGPGRSAAAVGPPRRLAGLGRRDGRAASPPAAPRSVSAWRRPEAEEPVVAGLADAVGAELRPALEVVRAAARRGPRRTTGSRTSRGRAPARAAPTAVDRRPRPERRDVDERVRVEDLGQQLDAVDDPRAGPAEVGRAVEREDLAAPDGGQVLVAGRPSASAPTRRRVSARWKPHGISRSISGSTSATASQVVWTRRLAVRAEQLPAAGPPDLLGHPVAGRERRVEPLEADDARRPAARLAPGLDLLLDRAEPLAQALDEVDRVVLRLGHRADRRDRVEDPLDRGRLERDDRDVGVDRAGRPR